MSTGFLTSFHYYRTHDMSALAGTLEGFPLFADSGAYSAMSLGSSVQLSDYADWLKQYSGLFTTYANLDVIGSPEGTWRNQLAMERLGFQPIPVFHFGAPWEYLHRYLDRGDPYIALGGMVGAPKAVKPWAIRCFQLAKGKAVFHGFGRTNLTELRDFPWYSVDSSSWGMGYRFGSVDLFDNGKWVKIRVGDHVGVYSHAHLIRAHGVDPKFIADRTLYHWKYACQISAVAWHRLGMWVHKRHGPINIPHARPTEPGPHLYLADTAKVHFDIAVAALSSTFGPHLCLADANSASGQRVAIASTVIRELEERA